VQKYNSKQLVITSMILQQMHSIYCQTEKTANVVVTSVKNLVLGLPTFFYPTISNTKASTAT